MKHSAFLFSRASFGDISQQFIELRRTELRASTIRRCYEPTFQSFLNILPDKPLQSYSPLDVALYTRERMKQVSGTSTNIHLRCLKSFGTWCAQMELLPEKNAFNKLKLVRVEDKPVRWMSVEEFKKVFSAEPSQTLRTIYLVAVGTGIRLNQLLHLKWSDVDLVKGTVRLDASSSKNKRTSILPLNRKVVELLKGLVNPKHHYVFQKPSACIPVPLNPSYVSHRFLKASRNAKVDGVSFHSLRKSCGSWLIQGGVPLYHVSKMLTHQSVTTTEKFYLGLSLEQLSEQVNKVDLIPTL